ncbi:rod shape-determining protein MreC [Fusobacterium sp.]|uniref:rod shape-determining protein MreC n=1 Tax=Fusobacterium sp. TaxID=68766 RepID=UPI00396CE671
MIRNNKNSNNFFSKKLVIILLAIVFAFALFQGIVNYGVELISYVVFPIQKKIYEAGNYIKDTSDAVAKYKEILQENETLKEQNIKYERAMTCNRQLLNENIRLRRILNMKEEKELSIRVAKVNFKNHNNLYERFYIDLGKNDNIKKNMIVLSEDNKLVGKIGRVYSDYSVVDMITGENSNVSGLSESNMLGIIKGSNEDDGTLYFEPNTFQNTLHIGEKIYTSGVSDIYPKGIYIGEISEIDDARGDVFRSIKVKNDIDVLDLNEVLILIPQEIKEEKKK